MPSGILELFKLCTVVGMLDLTPKPDPGILIGALAFEHNIFDGHTVPAVLAQIKRVLGQVPSIGIADRGYRGKPKVNDTRIMIPKPARANASQEAMALARKRFRRRAGIEPLIGHLKSDHRLKRNFQSSPSWGSFPTANYTSCPFRPWEKRALKGRFDFWWRTDPFSNSTVSPF